MGHGRVLQARIMHTESMVGLICTIAFGRIRFDALQIGCSNRVLLDGDLIVQVGARVSDEERARHCESSESRYTIPGLRGI